MKKTSKYRLYLSSCFLLWGIVLQGQTISVSNNLVFYSYNEMMNGKQGTLEINIQCSCGTLLGGGSPIPNWSITIRALDSYYKNPTYPQIQIPVQQHTTIDYNNVSGINANGPMDPNPIPGTFPLSGAETTLISGTPALEGGLLGPVNLNYQFDFFIAGGDHLILPAGNYTVPVEITLYNQNNAPIGNTPLTANIGFEIGSGGGILNEFSTIALQQGADNVQFVFDSPSDYLNGISVSKTGGLNVQSTQPHEVWVKTSNTQLISQTTSSTIPVSKFYIEATQVQSRTGIITGPAKPLSANEIVLIKNTRDPLLGILIPEITDYDLEYSLPAGSADQGLGPPATYSTQVYFIIIPQ